MTAGNPGVRFLGIRTKLLLTLAALILLITAALSAVGIISILSISKERQRTAEQELLQSSSEKLILQNRALASETSRLLERAEHDLRQFSALLGAAFDQAGAEPALESEFENLVRLPTGQMIGEPSDLPAVFVPASASNNPDLQEELGRSAAANPYWPTIVEDNPAVRMVYFATPGDLLRLYPGSGVADVLPPDFKPTAQDWYVAGEPGNNSDRRPRWIPAHPHLQDGEQVVTLSLPVYTSSGDFAGVLGMDLSLEQLLEPLKAGQAQMGGYSFLMDNQGRAFGLTEQGFRDFLGRPPEAGETAAGMQLAREAFTPILARMLTASEGSEIVQVDERRLAVVFSPLKTTDWSIGTVLEVSSILQSAGIEDLNSRFQRDSIQQITTRLLPLSLAVLLVSLFLAWLLANSQTKPVRSLASAVDKISANEWRAPIRRTRNDEIGLLESSLENLRNRLHDTEWERDRLAANRIPQPENGKGKLEVTAEVGLAAAREQDLNALLEQIVHIISRRFGYERAAVYLTGEPGGSAVLRAASSPGGPEILESGHRALSGDTGGVGYVLQAGVTRNQENRIDSGEQDPPSILLESRPTLAFPLKHHENLFGVLELTSSREEEFTQESIESLKVIAEQTAFAIHYYHLLQELQKGLSDADAYYQSAPEQLEREEGVEREPSAFEFDSNEVTAAAGRRLDPAVMNRLQAGEMVVLDQPEDETGEGKSQLLVPIRLLGKTVGVIGFEMADAEEGLGAEQRAMIESLTGQAALALENARLLEEAQKRATEERLLSDITCRIRETLNIDTVLQTAASEIQQRLNLQEVTIRLGENE